MTRKTEIDALLDRVQDWPPEDRVALAYRILRDLRRQPLSAPPRQTLARAIGLLKTDAPPPNDEQVKQWIEEERFNKYGR